MRLNLRVTYLDESAVDVTASAADLVAFEQRWDKSVTSFGSEVRITDLCWLAWHSIHRRKETALDFEAWLETIDSVRSGTTPEMVPLETVQPTG